MADWSARFQEALEVLMGWRGNKEDRAVRFKDLDTLPALNTAYKGVMTAQTSATQALGAADGAAADAAAAQTAANNAQSAADIAQTTANNAGSAAAAADAAAQQAISDAAGALTAAGAAQTTASSAQASATTAQSAADAAQADATAALSAAATAQGTADAAGVTATNAAAAAVTAQSTADGAASQATSALSAAATAQSTADGAVVDAAAAASAAVTAQSTANTNAGHLSGTVVMTVQAGNTASLLQLVAADNHGQSISLAKISAANIILDGTVSTEMLVVGMGRNLLENTAFRAGTLHWALSGTGAMFGEASLDLLDGGTSYAGASYPTLRILQTGTSSAGTIVLEHISMSNSSYGAGLGTPVVADATYDFSASISTLRCAGTLRLAFFDVAGTPVGTPVDITLPDNVAGSTTNPETWPRYWGLATAPTGAAFARFTILKGATSSGVDSAIHLYKPQISLSHANAITPAAYSPDGSTLISGDQLMTGSIVAGHIVAGAIEADKIAAEAITADKIAANSVTADHMSVDKLSAISAKMGALEVTEALTMQEPNATFFGGKTASGDVLGAGYYFGRVARDAVTAGSFAVDQEYKILTIGTTNFTLIGAASNTVGVVFRATGVGSGTGTATKIGYETSAMGRSGNVPSGYSVDDNGNLLLINPKKMIGEATGAATEYTSGGDFNLGVIPSVTLGATGGGGAGGYGLANGYATSRAASGSDTVIELYDGNPASGGVLKATYTALGGLGGYNAPQSRLNLYNSGENGQASTYGAGGLGAAAAHDVGLPPATSAYGAGGGGAGGDGYDLFDNQLGASGGGGFAGEQKSWTVNTSTYASVWIRVTIGAGAATNTGGNFDGGAGRQGIASASSALSSLLDIGAGLAMWKYELLNSSTSQAQINAGEVVTILENLPPSMKGVFRVQWDLSVSTKADTGRTWTAKYIFSFGATTLVNESFSQGDTQTTKVFSGDGLWTLSGGEQWKFRWPQNADLDINIAKINYATIVITGPFEDVYL